MRCLAGGLFLRWPDWAALPQAVVSPTRGSSESPGKALEGLVWVPPVLDLHSTNAS